MKLKGIGTDLTRQTATAKNGMKLIKNNLPLAHHYQSTNPVDHKCSCCMSDADTVLYTQTTTAFNRTQSGGLGHFSVHRANDGLCQMIRV